MARFPIVIWDSTTESYLSGQTIVIKDALGGTTLASTTDIGVGLLVSPNGDGSYYCDDIPAQDLWVYVNGAIQQEYAGIPWDNGESGVHIAASTAHGTTADIMGQDEVDGASIEYSSGLRVKALGIVEAMLGSLSVVAGKIASNAVTTAKIINDAVTTPKILDANVTGAKLASAVAGDGLKKDGSGNLEVEVSTVSTELDLGINSAGQLKLLKTFPVGSYIHNEMTFDQLMTAIDNRMRQLSEQGAGVSGAFYQTLFVGATENNPAGGSVVAKIFTTVSATYADAIVFEITKIPQMRQVVLYYKTYASDALASGYIKLDVGGLTIESAVIDFTSGSEEYRALYLDISSLSNWETHEFNVNMKVSGGYTLSMRSVSLIVRDDVTSMSGEPTYETENPVE